MPTLLETLAVPSKRPAVIADCVTMVDEEVASKGGISGFAIKAAYRIVKGIKPGFIAEVVDALLDDFCRNLQPSVDAARSSGRPIAAWFGERRGEVAEALLAITDARAQRAKNALIKSTYEKLRPMAKRNVEEAVPRVGNVIQKHAA